MHLCFYFVICILQVTVVEEAGIALGLPPTTDGTTMARHNTESRATVSQEVDEEAQITKTTVIEATVVVEIRYHVNFINMNVTAVVPER